MEERTVYYPICGFSLHVSDQVYDKEQPKLFSTTTCYPILLNLQNGEIVTDGDGHFLLSVNVYDSGSRVDSVKCGIWGEEGNTWTTALDSSKWHSMYPTSDWNWQMNFNPGSEEEFTMVVEAYLRSGEVVHRKEFFQVVDAFAPAKVSAEWHNLGGNPAHTGIVENNQKPPYTLKWTRNLGSNIYMSSPVVSGSKVMTAVLDDGNGRRANIQCHNAANGNLHWKVETEHSIKNQMVIAQDLLIATYIEGMTYAIDIDDGEIRWKRDIEYTGISSIISGSITDGEVVYAGF